MFGDPTSFAVSRSGLVLWRSCQLAAEVPSWFSTWDGPGCGSWLWFDSMCQTPPGVRRFRRLPTRREAPRGANARAPASIRHVGSWRGLGEPKSASFGRSSCAGRQQTFQFTITHFYKTTDTETHELFKQSQTMGGPACPVALPAQSPCLPPDVARSLFHRHHVDFECLLPAAVSRGSRAEEMGYAVRGGRRPRELSTR